MYGGGEGGEGGGLSSGKNECNDSTAQHTALQVCHSVAAVLVKEMQKLVCWVCVSALDRKHWCEAEIKGCKEGKVRQFPRGVRGQGWGWVGG